MAGRTKVYESLVRTTFALTPEDLGELDSLPGGSRNDRIRYLLAIHRQADLIVEDYAALPGFANVAESEMMADVEKLAAMMDMGQ